MNSLLTMGLNASYVNSILTFGLNLSDQLIILPPIINVALPNGGPSGGDKSYNGFINYNSINDYKKKKKLIRMLMKLNDYDLKYDYEAVDKYIKAKIFNIDESFSEKKIIRVLIENVEDL